MRSRFPNAVRTSEVFFQCYLIQPIYNFNFIMNNKLYISILFIILPVYLWGAVIRGKVVDSHNDPVMFANVILLNDSVFINGTTSDEVGGFSIENASEANVIKVSCIGFEDYFCSVGNRGDIGTIVLQEAYTMLDEVIVKANLPQTQLKGNAMVTSVQNTALAKMGNAYDVLSHIPMVTGINGELNVFGQWRNLNLTLQMYTYQRVAIG